MEISKTKFINLPEIPGVYTFWKKNTPIYIGKSVNLRSRLNSYLDTNLLPKTAQMIKEADKVTYIEVTSELESLLLESHLIKKYKPKYNIISKDDKHALYIAITNEEFPRVFCVRKLLTINSSFLIAYGPFPNSTNVKTILRLIRKIFPYSDHKIGKKPCLYSHLGLCNPCPNTGINRKTYLNNIRNIKLVLSRKFNVVRKSLEKEMNLLSKEQKYEEAKIIRDKIKALDYITQEKIDTQEFLQNPNLVEDLRSLEIKNLQTELNKNCKSVTGKAVKIKNLYRIECYDIAHLNGSSPTASMVVMIDGEMDHSLYRHFKVKQKNGQSDYDSLREIANRRIKHLVDWHKPDLIIVDGGLGQVKIFDEVFLSKGRSASGRNIPVVGIAKNPDRLVFPDGTKIRLQGLTLQLMGKIRNEAHRFARRLHHKLLSKSLLA